MPWFDAKPNNPHLGAGGTLPATFFNRDHQQKPRNQSRRKDQRKRKPMPLGPEQAQGAVGGLKKPFPMNPFLSPKLNAAEAGDPGRSRLLSWDMDVLEPEFATTRPDIPQRDPAGKKDGPKDDEGSGSPDKGSESQGEAPPPARGKGARAPARKKS